MSFGKSNFLIDMDLGYTKIMSDKADKVKYLVIWLIYDQVICIIYTYIYIYIYIYTHIYTYINTYNIYVIQQ